jgi:hypothetical protein
LDKANPVLNSHLNIVSILDQIKELQEKLQMEPKSTLVSLSTDEHELKESEKKTKQKIDVNLSAQIKPL